MQTLSRDIGGLGIPIGGYFEHALPNRLLWWGQWINAATTPVRVCKRQSSEGSMGRSEWDCEFAPPQPPGTPLEKETPRRRLVGWLIAIVLIAMVAVGGLLGWQELKIRTVTASDARLSNTVDSALAIDTVALGRKTWVYYHVTLNGAPKGRRIDLACEWVDPRWTTRHEVEYETRRVDKSPWPTHCRNRFAPGMEPGTWTVRLYVEERLVSETLFEVVRSGG